MENIIYNELLIRGFNVDVGVMEINEKKENRYIRKQLEVDFICNLSNQKYYIQSAYTIPGSEKMNQEQKPLIHIPDSFKKIIVVNDNMKPWRNDYGILFISLKDFLLNNDCLDL